MVSGLIKEYAKANSIKVGDTLPVTYNSNKVNLKVKGIIQSPNHIYFTGTQDFIAPNYSNYGYAYVSPNTLYGKLGLSRTAKYCRDYWQTHKL